MQDGNVAFKCTYNDGGDRGFVGFRGICSNGNIVRNVQTNRKRWRSNEEILCRRFYEGGFRVRRPTRPCLESQIFTLWGYSAGTYHAGVRAGQPIPMKHARVGKVALLTTRHPEYDSETVR